jgi:hypothetical protein
MSDYNKIKNDLVNKLTYLKDDLENMLRKKPTSSVQTKIPLKNPEKYSKLWFDNQDDLVLYYLKNRMLMIR